MKSQLSYRKSMKKIIGIFLLLGLLTGLEGGMGIFAAQGEKSSSAEPTQPPGFWHRFSLEFHGGFTSLSPDHFNLIPERYERLQLIRYDEFYAQLLNSGQILSWDKFQEGEYRKIKWAFPFGARLKFELNRFLSISVGIKSINRDQSSHINFEYTRVDPYDTLREVKNFSPFSLSVTGYVPQFGIHFLRRLSKKFGLEGYMMGGPLIAEIEFATDWTYAWGVMYDGYFAQLYETEGVLRESGEGTGYSLEFGGRLDWNLGRRVGLFLETGYALQKVTGLTGSGRERQGASEQTWEGEWALQLITVDSSAGPVELAYPTSYWLENSLGIRSGDFKLDLSGFQIRLGFSFRF